MSSPLPEYIGRFRIEGLLGSGGMGDVYKGFDPSLKRSVAVKTVRADIGSPESVERLHREAEACARLQHPGIVTIHEVGEFEGGVFIAMEHLKGHTLAKEIRTGRLSLSAKIAVLTQILDALVHAHAEQVIHRDIKPGNVHVQPDGSIKLLDFGLARMESADTITESGSVMGTPNYASPEQLRAERVDARSDVFSVGALAYELFEGRKPFEADSVSAVLIKVLTEPPVPPAGQWARHFPALADIVLRAMAKAPADRFQTAGDMRGSLTAFADAEHSAIAAFDAIDTEATTKIPSRAIAESPDAPERLAPTAVETLPRPAQWRTPAGIAALFVLVAALLVYQQFHRGAPEPASGGGEATAASRESSATRPETAASEPPRSRDTSHDPAGVSATASGRTAGTTPVPAPGASTPTPSGLASASTPAAPAARELFSAAGGAAQHAGLRWRVILKRADAEEMDADPDQAFRSGDRVRLAFESNIDGFLYVALQGSSRRWSILFPDPSVNGGSNAIGRGQLYQVPNNGWFRFDETPGDEELFVVLSRERLSGLPGFKGPVSKPEVVPVEAVDTVKTRIASRDLIFEKDPPPPAGSQAKVTRAHYVVNRDELGSAVSATVTLKHTR